MTRNGFRTIRTYRDIYSDSDANTCRNTYSDPDANAYRNTYSDPDANAYRNTYSDFDAATYQDLDKYCRAIKNSHTRPCQIKYDYSGMQHGN